MLANKVGRTSSAKKWACRAGVTGGLAEDGEGGEVCRVALLLYGRLACFGLVLVASWRADMGANGVRPALVGETRARWLETHTDERTTDEGGGD